MEMNSRLREALYNLFRLPNWKYRGEQKDVMEALQKVYEAWQEQTDQMKNKATEKP